MRAGYRCENMVFVSIFVCFFCLSHSSLPVRCSSRDTYFEQVLCHRLWVDFDTVFSFFQKGLHFQKA